MNIWLHRISHHADVSYPLLKKGILTIGFSSLSDKEFLQDLSLNGWDALVETINKRWGGQSRIRHNIWRFIREMKKDDLVLIPGWKNFSIYKITGDNPHIISEIENEYLTDWNGNSLHVKDDGLIYRIKDDELIDLGFFWNVEPIAVDIPRDKYADSSLTARMKIRSTNAQINDLQLNIEEAIDSFEHSRPIDLHAQIIESAVPMVVRSIHKNLTPEKLEKLIKWYFKRIGASSVYIPPKNESRKEGDADVIATFEPIKTIIYAQAKFHTGETDSWALEQIRAYKAFKKEADTGYSRICWVITTGNSYSEQALAMATEESIQLFDEKTFATLLLEAGVNGLDEALN